MSDGECNARGAGDEEPGTRFVWPPRVPGLAPRAPVEVKAAGAGEKTPMPPRIAPTMRSAESKVRATVVHLDTPRTWWAEVERVWLGVTAPPLLERAAEAGWVPDSARDYCRRCGASARPGEQSGVGVPEGCAACREAKVPWDRLVRLGAYEDPLDRWIREVKFARFRRLGEDLGVWLGESIAAELERARQESGAGVPTGAPVIVPVPMSFLHRMWRGVDHTMALSRGVRRATGGAIVPALARAHRPSQLQVRPSDRKANVAGAFRLKPWAAEAVAGRLVVVVDDVTTTGATLGACVRVLKGIQGLKGGIAKPSAIWAAAAAWTPEHRRAGPMT